MQIPEATVPLPTFKKGVRCSKMLCPLMCVVHAQCGFSTLKEGRAGWLSDPGWRALLVNGG